MKDRGLSCPHLHRDLTPPQHAGSGCCTSWTVFFFFFKLMECSVSKVGGHCVTSLMLGARVDTL